MNQPAAPVHTLDAPVCRGVLAVLLAFAAVGSPPALGATMGAAVAVQHKRVAELSGPAVQYREGGPGLVLTARGDGRGAPQARLDVATTRTPTGPSHWSARLELERQHVAGPFYLGGRMSFESEGVEGIGTCANRMQLAQTAGVRFTAGPARVQVGAGLPAVGVLARRGTTSLAPDLIDHPWARGASIPAALYATGPWNAPAVDLTGRASWSARQGEAWVSVRTTLDRLDVGAMERRVMTVQPEVGWRWGRGIPSEAPTFPRRPVPVTLPPVEPPVVLELVPVPADAPPPATPPAAPAPEEEPVPEAVSPSPDDAAPPDPTGPAAEPAPSEPAL